MFHLYVEDVFQYKADEIVEVYRYLDKLEIDKTKLKTDPPYQIKEYLTLDISFVRRDERKEERIRIYEEVRCLTTNG
ncbi:MAG: hypothetical protein RML94_00205 [Bacteroidia bacterium]|nr:hypothetical protein [Bacteroidia bacterium]